MGLKNIKNVSLFNLLSHTFGRNSTPPAFQFLCRIHYHLANNLRISHKVSVTECEVIEKGIMEACIGVPSILLLRFEKGL